MEEIEHGEECTCGIPEDALVTAVVCAVEYLDRDGNVGRANLCHDGSEGPIDPDKVTVLTEWLKDFYHAADIADMVAQMLGLEFIDEEGEE